MSVAFWFALVLFAMCLSFSLLALVFLIENKILRRIAIVVALIPGLNLVCAWLLLAVGMIMFIPRGLKELKKLWSDE